MTRTLAMELGGDGITVNAVAPGPIATELFRQSNPEGAPRTQRILDNDADYVDPQDMLAELRSDNQQLTREMRRVHELCDEYGDVATASLLENWIDEAERRVWFLYEAARTESHSRT